MTKDSHHIILNHCCTTFHILQCPSGSTLDRADTTRFGIAEMVSIDNRLFCNGMAAKAKIRNCSYGLIQGIMHHNNNIIHKLNFLMERVVQVVGMSESKNIANSISSMRLSTPGGSMVLG